MATYQSQYTGAQIDAAVGAIRSENFYSYAKQIVLKHGYIDGNGNIQSATDRNYTNLIPCDAGVNITYQAETNHSNISALTVYDINNNIIDKVKNVGANDSDHTYTTPPNTAFIRFSLASGQAGKFVFDDAIVATAAAENKTNFNTLKQKVGDIITNPTYSLSTGKYVGWTGIGVGVDWTTLLTTDSGSKYTAVTIDVSNYIGQKIRLTTSSRNTRSGRASGFCDSNNLISSYYCEGLGASPHFDFSQVNGKYVANVPITDDYFFVSISNAAGLEKIEIVQDNLYNEIVRTVYTKEEVDNRLTKGIYVDGVNGSDSNNGTSDYPLKTIQAAIDKNIPFIYVKAGTYAEKVLIQGKSNIHIVPAEYGTYSSSVPDTPKIIIDGGNSRILCLEVRDSCGIELTDVYCKNSANYGFWFYNSKEISATRCIASDCAGNGFRLNNSSGVFKDCLAYNIGGTGVGYDGFTIHGYGNTQFINCVAHDCGDDGISHHDGCTGLISGGEYYNCGKGGVASPTHGAYVDVENVYSHNNVYGLYADNANNRTVKGRISNCVFKDNTTYDIYINDGNMVGWNNIYDTKNVTSGSTFTELS